MPPVPDDEKHLGGSVAGSSPRPTGEPDTAWVGRGVAADRGDVRGVAVVDTGEVARVVVVGFVEGEVLLPNGVNVGGRVAEEHANMIGIRGQFTNQLIWLSNDI